MDNKKIEKKYFELCYTLSIHEYYKIDQYKGWTEGKAKKTYKSIRQFYLEELGITEPELIDLENYFALYDELHVKYYNKDRDELFKNPEQLLDWYAKQNNTCNYCDITLDELAIIVQKRKGNLTLNNKTKRSKGTLEIEKLNPDEKYTFKNSVLACPFCNNAKSNLISEVDWRKYFAPAMKIYLKSLL